MARHLVFMKCFSNFWVRQFRFGRRRVVAAPAAQATVSTSIEDLIAGLNLKRVEALEV